MPDGWQGVVLRQAEQVTGHCRAHVWHTMAHSATETHGRQQTSKLCQNGNGGAADSGCVAIPGYVYIGDMKKEWNAYREWSMKIVACFSTTPKRCSSAKAFSALPMHEYNSDGCTWLHLTVTAPA